jgi:hypothetical protein
MYKISLEKDDYLRFQLFTASKSKKIRNKRISSWILSLISLLCLSYLFSQLADKFLENYFLIFSVITLIFYPFYNSWYYKRHYLKYVEENYKNQFGVISEIEFKDGYILSRDPTGESKTRLNEFYMINEIRDDLFIRLKSGMTIIVPSRTVDFDKLKLEIRELTQDTPVEWNDYLDWKWR